MQTAVFQGTQETNKVLRNTFILLALTLLPTVLGTYLAIDMGLPAVMQSSPWLSFFGTLAVMIGLLFAINATSESALGIGFLGLFTLVCGAVLSGVVSAALSLSNGADLVALAFVGTASILAGCSFYAATTKRDFSSLRGFLMGSLLAVIVLMFLNVLFFQLPGLQVLIAAVCLVLFSIFLIYDVQRVVNGGETNYILATTTIYLDLVNIFSSLLQLLMAAFGGDSD